jgi:hypothetical protein
VEAIKTLFAFSAVVASQLAIARATGAEVDTDPDSPNFLRGKWGPMRVDFSAGFQGHIRLALRLAKHVYESKVSGEKPSSEPTEIVGTYLRGKESPSASFAHDVLLSRKTEGGYGTDIIGKTVYPFGDPEKKGYERAKSSALFKRIDPMLHRDAEEAYDLMGWKGGAAAGILSFIGEGVNTYEEDSGGSRSSRPSRPARPTRPSGQ